MALQVLSLKTFKVTYTKRIEGEGSILVKAQDANQAIKNAKFLCATGSDFRNAIATNEEYKKPRKQDFQGRQ